MKRVLRVVVPVLVLLVSTSALAQEGGGGSSERPRGFALEVGIAASTVFYESLGGLGGVMSSVSLSPRLGLGAQLGRLSLALNLSLGVVGQTYEAPGGDELRSNIWTVRLGPYVDGEIWSSGRIALFLFGGLDVLVFRDTDEDPDDDDTGATGFSLDVGLGGRIYVLPQFPIGIKVGTAFEMAFWDEAALDIERRSLAWSIYGALAFRFVASR